ncbi:hypothetical protein ACPSLY_06440 [Vibrio parahaemolyticus]|uniref:hypothetical protein n=1 Tax=Vibrio harveyi group TaxID=717610 RepID=UPI00289531AE|nr:conserved hypothetical protein [Vibrio owensii]CAH1591907.1 conserved hypothetical protein [Vibrio owensii]
MENFTQILNIIYLLSGPMLVVIAYIALGQIKVAKLQLEEQRKVAQIQSKRDALKLMSEQVSAFNNVTLQLGNDLDDKIERENITFFDQAKVKVSEKGISINIRDFGSLEELDPIIPELTKFANSLDSLSIYFLSGVADEDQAFRAIGSNYCDSVKDILPFLVMANDYDEHCYSNCLQLFMIWHNRLEVTNMLKQRQELESQIKDRSIVTIKPVGTA